MSLARSRRDASNFPAVNLGVTQAPLLSDTDWRLVKSVLFTTARILKNLASLQTLAIGIGLCRTKAHYGAFDPNKISLPSIKTLMLGPGMEWLVPICPNVTSISTYQAPGNYQYMDKEAACELVDSAAQAPLLNHLEVFIESMDMLQHIAASLPRLASLVIVNSKAIRDIAPILGRFANLAHLGLPRASVLGVGFRPPGCGNYYMGKDGPARREQVERARREANRKVAELALSACRTLQTVTIGENTVATAERSKEGALLDFTVGPVERDSPRPVR